MVRRKRRLFARFKGRRDVEELIAEGIAAAWKDWPSYNPAKSAVSTYIYRCAASHLIDLYRGECRNQRRDHAGCSRSSEVQEHDPVPAFEWADMTQFGQEMQLRQWLRATYNASKAMCCAGRWRQGRRYYTGAQLVTIYLLRRRNRLSERGCRMLLRQRADLRAVLGLRADRLPHNASIGRAQKLLSTAPDYRRPKRRKLRGVLAEVAAEKIIFGPPPPPPAAPLLPANSKAA